MIKTILWDIDDTVLDFKKAENHSLKRTFSHYGLGECTDEIVGIYSRINQSHWEMLERGEMTKQQVLKHRFTDFFKVMGINGIEEAEFCEYYENGLSDKIFFVENSIELLSELKKDYRQYAVTNGAREIQSARLHKSELDKIFDGAFISDAVGYEKPSMEFFDYVLKSVQYCKKDEIIIVGDSLTSDMKGGNNAGIKCCWYNPDNKVNDKNVRVDYQISALEQIKTII